MLKILKKNHDIALDFNEESGNRYFDYFDYELPDKTHLCVKKERIECPEALFKPNIIGKDSNGIHKTCVYSIEKCDIDIKKDLYSCIVLSGGTSMLDRLPERLEKEIKKLAPDNFKEEVNVIASPERKFAVWNGGSILSNLSTFESSWITKKEYDESGERIVHRKCF